MKQIMFLNRNKKESIKKEKPIKVVELEEKSEDEYFYDRFSSIEELNEYYKQMMAEKRVRSFKKQIKYKGEFQQKVENSDYFENKSMERSASMPAFSAEYVRSLVNDDYINSQIELQQKNEFETLNKDLDIQKIKMENRIKKLQKEGALMDHDLYQSLKILENSKMKNDSDNVYKKYKLNLEYLNRRKEIPDWEIRERTINMMYHKQPDFENPIVKKY